MLACLLRWQLEGDFPELPCSSSEGSNNTSLREGLRGNCNNVVRARGENLSLARQSAIASKFAFDRRLSLSKHSALSYTPCRTHLEQAMAIIFLLLD